MLNYENMSQAELQKKLTELKDLLDEVIEERDIILGQENLHLSSKLVTKYAEEIEEIKGNISQVERLLQKTN
ncbi:MAG: hypothetical protein AB7D36_10935 [Oscillospiraceae bacterium]